MLAQLVDMGLRVLAFTLDNGYISDQAIANIRRVVSALDVDHVFGKTEAMNEIFADSLKRHSNVCHGCFKTIYALSTKLALEKNIPFIVTGLSRGQFFETRLTEEIFTSPAVDPDQIDEIVLQARKAYHRVDDAVARCLDAGFLQADETFQRVRYLDFYRYCAVDLDDMYRYLDQRLPWVRPTDTGRSTNCLINDAGIFVHRKERGFHNYALPYSWDVRLGHKTREAALAELDDDIDVDHVQRILQEIGYDSQWSAEPGERLAAWYVSPSEIPLPELREHLAAQLPAWMIPSSFVRIDSIPLTANGKVDFRGLPDPSRQRPACGTPWVPPQTDLESALAAIWSNLLGQARVGIHDNFFDLGGDSILAIRIVARAAREGITFRPFDLFEAPTIAELAVRCGQTRPESGDRSAGPFPPTPVQQWFLQHDLQGGDFWNQSVMVETASPLDPRTLQSCLEFLIRHHDAFRQKFFPESGTWRARTVEATGVYFQTLDLTSRSAGEARQQVSEAEKELHAGLSFGSGALLGALLLKYPQTDRCLLAANHLAVDAVSWSLLLEDLDTLLTQAGTGQPWHLDPVPTFRQWALHEARLARTPEVVRQRDEWLKRLRIAAFEPGGGASKAADLQQVRVRLDRLTTASLRQEVCRQARASMEELLMAAFAAALTGIYQPGNLRMFVERHGRDTRDGQADAGRTVGWFTMMAPVVLSLASGLSLAEITSRVKQGLRQLPGDGTGYGRLRYADPPEPAFADLAECESRSILFNYLGVLDESAGSPWRIVRPLRLHRSATCPVNFAWQFHGGIRDGALEISLEFDGRRHPSSRLQTLLDAVLQRLHDLADLRQWQSGAAVVASDFPMAGLDQQQLARLANLLEGQEKGGQRQK
jgi:non-ribosomal peptide synthase protein (TIGR01720 family)